MKASPTAVVMAASALVLLPGAALAQHEGHDMSGMDHTSQVAPESPWRLHTHTVLNLVADQQSGPRGGDKTFVSGMAMLTAERKVGPSGTLILSTMVTPDPVMGPEGYPLLLQAGESADGVTPLTDAQHPHDLFMDLSVTYRHKLSEGRSAYIKLGWPTDVTFGPTTFMHRASGEAFPTAPITHHWFDSTHISMGALSTGYTQGPFTLEATQFTGREPDENRYDLERPRFDSTAVRVGWRVSSDTRLQASWMRQTGPEGLEPDEDALKMSVSLESRFGPGDITLAFGRKQHPASDDKPEDAWLAEGQWPLWTDWTLLTRYERVRTHELDDESHWVAKTELGGIRTFQITETTRLGVGVVRQWNHVPEALKSDYGPSPHGWVGFLRLTWMSMSGM